MKKIYQFSKVITFLLILFFVFVLSIYNNASIFLIVCTIILIIVFLWGMGTSVTYDETSIYLKFLFFKRKKIDYKDIIKIGETGKRGNYVVYRKEGYNYPIEAYFQEEKIKEINEYIISVNEDYK